MNHREGGYFFAHGGVLPGVPLTQQREGDLIWIRRRFLCSTADHGAVVVHGHCISAEPEVRANRIGIDTGASESGVLTCLVLDGEEPFAADRIKRARPPLARRRRRKAARSARRSGAQAVESAHGTA